MRVLLLLPILLLASACSLSAPEIDAAVTPESRRADWPELVPLGPLLAQEGALAPRAAEIEGRTLEWRAADLRRRAALLRAIQIQ